MAVHPTDKKPSRSNKKQQQTSKKGSSWDQIKTLLTCRQVQASQVHHPSPLSSCSRICTFRDVVHGNTRVVSRPPDDAAATATKATRLLAKKTAGTCAGGRGMPPLRKLSGCYECHAIVDASRYPLPRTSICPCNECGEVFPKIESLEHHKAVKHAVCEIGPDDSSRNIVEIIFKSSWLKRDHPICKIERILKVQPTQRTIQRFEDYRNAVKTRGKGNPRCAADGNELLRFHAATLACSLGDRGSSSLCGAMPACGVCTAIRHGFPSGRNSGIRTTASSGRAHDCLGGGEGRRAMLVCRVIAGRVKCVAEAAVVVVEEEGGRSFEDTWRATAVCIRIWRNCVCLVLGRFCRVLWLFTGWFDFGHVEGVDLSVIWHRSPVAGAQHICRTGFSVCWL